MQEVKGLRLCYYILKENRVILIVQKHITYNMVLATITIHKGN